MKTLKITLAGALLVTIIAGTTRAFAFNYSEEPGVNICLTDGECKGKCIDDVEGGKTCRAQAADQDCSGTGTKKD